MTNTLAELPVEYLTKEDGERTGVVLRWKDFRALQAMLPADPDTLVGLSKPELTALADGILATRHQDRLALLLEHNRLEQLTASETVELDDLLAQVDSVNILKARALYTLQLLDQDTAHPQ